MTNVKTNTNRPFVNGAFSRSRTGDTFSALMEQAEKLRIGQRIADARERSRWTQENIADHLGLTVRGYQKVEEKGTTSYERCEVLAAFLDVPGVTPLWLYEGRGAGPGGDGDRPRTLQRWAECRRLSS